RRLLELNAIQLKACATNPRERYASARQMLADLERLQEGVSIRNRQRWQAMWRYGRLFFLGAVLFASVAGVFYLSMPGEKQAPEPEFSKNSEANDEYQKGILAFHSDSQNGFEEAIEHFRHAVAKDNTFALAYARLAQAYCWLHPRSRRNLEKSFLFA